MNTGPIDARAGVRDDSLARVTHGLGRVLVVDDDEVIRQLIAVNLTLEGFDVVTAVDGKDCLDKVVDADPDVITLDVMMPRLDGWVTATQLRRNPKTAGIKVVLITANPDEAGAVAAARAGADGYLDKGIDSRKLPQVLKAVAAGQAAYPRRFMHGMLQAIGQDDPERSET